MAAGGSLRTGSSAAGLPGRALADFDSAEYGVDYVGFEAGEQVNLLVCRDEDKGWAYGERARDGARGWFPISYWRRTPVEEQRAAEPARNPAAAFPAVAAGRGTGAGDGAAASTVGRPSAVIEVIPVAAASATYAGQPEATPAAASGSTISPLPEDGITSAVYDRAMMLHVGFSLLHNGSVDGDTLGITTQETEPSDGAKRPDKPDESLLKLVEAAGGHVRVRNLAAAGLALGIVSGGHSKVCQDIMKIVRARQDLFLPMPEVSDVTKLSVTLRANIS
mmetsp:Transcript_77104/g.223086  ORF Transcript_77104/g.223086 Transcript_77104/m.223086 type:complete len:278 (-) Transcript_77104:56-889(-)